MKIELKNLKHSKWASQETDCFHADVWINGKRAGQVSNHGQGAANDYSPWELAETLNEYAATLAPTTYEIGGKTHTIPEDADSIISRAFVAKLHERDLRRMLANRVIYVDREGKLMQTKTTTKQAMSKILEMPNLFERLNATKILNFLSIDEALSIYARS